MMSTAPPRPRRSSSKEEILRLVGVLAFVACCNHGITRYWKESSNRDVMLRRKLAGAPLWGSEDTFGGFGGFGGVIPKVNGSNGPAKNIALDSSFLASKPVKEQEIILQPKPQNLTFLMSANTTTGNEQAQNLPLAASLFLAFNPGKKQETNVEPKPQQNTSTSAATASNEQDAELEDTAYLSAESTTSPEPEESSEELAPEIQRCFPPVAPPPMPGKRGICFTLRDEGRKGSWLENLPKVIALNPYWNYSWDSKRIAMQPENIEFVPMIWGAWGSEGLEQRITRDVLPQIESGQAKRLLGFNEPDFEKQSNLSVDEAVSYWPILAKIDLPLASPSAGHATRPWMVEFMQKTEESCLRIEYIAVHWYGAPNAAVFKNKMREAYALYGSWRPMLITEFAIADWDATTLQENRHSADEVLGFMKDVLPWMEEPEQDWIAGYSWFSFETSSPAGTSSALFDDDGNVTTLGSYYASVTTENPTGDQSI